jgi:hypothetical protein
MVSPRLDHFV